MFAHSTHHYNSYERKDNIDISSTNGTSHHNGGIGSPSTTTTTTGNARGHRRTSSSSLSYGETIHESSSDSEKEAAEELDVFRRASPSSYHSPIASNPFESFIMASNSPSPSSYLSTSPRIPSSLGNNFRSTLSTTPEYRRSARHRRSLPPSTSTSPMQGANLSGEASGGNFLSLTAGLSPSALKSIRRRSSGNNPSPFGSFNSSANSTPSGSTSPSLFSSSFVGSYEQSLLSGRMANKPSNAATPLPFTASVGVLGLGKNIPRALKCPDHVTIPFGAYFWDMDSREKQGKGSPYVGTLDLSEHYLSILEQRQDLYTDLDPNRNFTASSLHAPSHLPDQDSSSPSSSTLPRFPGYRIPPKGQIQVVIKNANQTAVKLFLVPYDLSDMPPGSKTFIRQKSYDTAASATSSSSSPSSSATGLAPPAQSDSSPAGRTKETLRYAIHLQFCAVPAKPRERGRKKGNVSGSASRSRKLSELRHQITEAPTSHLQHYGEQSLSPRRRYNVDGHNASPSRPASPHASHRRSGQRARRNTATASHIYLYKSIRVAFTSRALDLSEKLKTVYEGPSGLQAPPSSKEIAASSADGPVDKDEYSSFTGAGEEWEDARRRRLEADRAYARQLAQVRNFQLHLEDPVPLDPNGEIATPEGEDTSPAHTDSSRGSAIHQSLRYALLNTPPSVVSLPNAVAAKTILLGQEVKATSTSSPDANLDAAVEQHPEPLTFERSPVSRNAPLPSLLESALSISRPGSRSRNHPTSPEKNIFGTLAPKDVCR